LYYSKESSIKGQNCERFFVSFMNEKHEVIKKIEGTTIGNKRAITFPVTIVIH
jgi:hypothetical protein